MQLLCANKSPSESPVGDVIPASQPAIKNQGTSKAIWQSCPQQSAAAGARGLRQRAQPISDFAVSSRQMSVDSLGGIGWRPLLPGRASGSGSSDDSQKGGGGGDGSPKRWSCQKIFQKSRVRPWVIDGCNRYDPEQSKAEFSPTSVSCLCRRYPGRAQSSATTEKVSELRDSTTLHSLTQHISACVG